MHYLFDSEGFVTRYGGAAINEVIIGGGFLALTLAALLATPFFTRRAWGWLLPALASLPPVAFYMWLVFFSDHLLIAKFSSLTVGLIGSQVLQSLHYRPITDGQGGSFVLSSRIPA
jgi:hypothetical protein